MMISDFMNLPSGAEDATREGRGVKRRSDSSRGCFNDRPQALAGDVMTHFDSCFHPGCQ